MKRAFNSDPAKEPLRILICTDAAREGVNLQSYCADLIHFDLPWNPARLEQRNGRIDRKLQPAKLITCRYFRYAQREADVVLDALVRKTERIEKSSALRARSSRNALASAWPREASRPDMPSSSPVRSRRKTTSSDWRGLGLKWMTRSASGSSASSESAKSSRKPLENSRERVGVDALDLHNVVATALKRADYDLDKANSGPIGQVSDVPIRPCRGRVCAGGGLG